MNGSKKWWASKTFWFNILALIVTVAGAFGYSGDLTPEFEAFVPAIVATINLVLRLFFTKQPIEA